MKTFLLLVGLVAMLGLVVGCEEEEHEHHHHAGGAYYGPEGGYYNQGYYHSYPDYNYPYHY